MDLLTIYKPTTYQINPTLISRRFVPISAATIFLGIHPEPTTSPPPRSIHQPASPPTKSLVFRRHPIRPSSRSSASPRWLPIAHARAPLPRSTRRLARTSSQRIGEELLVPLDHDLRASPAPLRRPTTNAAAGDHHQEQRRPASFPFFSISIVSHLASDLAETSQGARHGVQGASSTSNRWFALDPTWEQTDPSSSTP